MERNKIYCLLFLLCYICTNHANAQGMHSDIELLRVKSQLQSNDSLIVKGYQQLQKEADQALKDCSHALADFSIPGRYTDSVSHVNNSKSLQTDAFNAYVCALVYRLNGDKKYGQKACELLDAWAIKNRGFSEYDGALVMAYSGAGLLNAALLLKSETIWKERSKEAFAQWTKNVYNKAASSIRYRKNNWADWGRYASLLSASFLGDKEEIAQNCSLIKSDIQQKIAKDGSMPKETIRGANGLWYTYFSLAPITASAWIIYNETGVNLFEMDFDGVSIKKALDYLLYYSKHPDEWPHCSKVNRPIDERWPYNLFEAMRGIYRDDAYRTFTHGKQPLIYPRHHYAWSFPTLMSPLLPAKSYEKLYVWVTPENPYKKTPEIDMSQYNISKLIKREHPRMFVTTEQIKRLRTISESDTTLQKYIKLILEKTENIINAASVRNERDAMSQILHLGFAYHWRNDSRYIEYAIKLILDICSKEQWDWVHFLGAAEASATVGLGYDIFYNQLDVKTRKQIKEALIGKGLLPGIGAYEGASYGWFRYVRHNWNLVCNSGLMIGALAIADDEETDFYANFIIPKAVESMALAMNEYAPDGAYPEGPGYWEFATSYTILGLEALNKSLGTDFGLSSFEGFDQTFYYQWYMTAPNGNLISYADCYPDSKNKPNGMLLWMANHYNDPVLAEREHQLIRNDLSRIGIYDILFYGDKRHNAINDIPCDRHFRGPVEVATMRTSWNDSNSPFISVKAGYNQVNHGHLDLGAFEYFALGEKWFYDLGSDNYYLPDFFDMNGGRWQYYRTASVSHNVPIINNENQNIYGMSKITSANLNKPLSVVEIDLSDVYKKHCSEMTRRLSFDKQKSRVKIEDIYSLNKAANVIWQGVTDAKVSIKNKVATLKKGDKSIKVEILSPSNATFIVEAAPNYKNQKPNENVSVLKVAANAKSGTVKIAVLITSPQVNK